MKTLTFLMLSLVGTPVLAKEYHVSIEGADANSGSAVAPFKTISAAANVAGPGDIITVHAGIYRERVTPTRGGTSEQKRITYQAARGDKVVICGSEVIKGWEQVGGATWRVTIPNRFFGNFYPYNDLISGDWFDGKGRQHHTGAVYFHGEWLTEAARQEDVLKPVGVIPLWFAQVDDANTRIWAQFPDGDPNVGEVEINVRQSVFYPSKPGCDYITVRGFTMRHAATPWSPPTAEQIGLLGTHWSKGWIIESNTISHSTCSGISLGKYGDEFDNATTRSERDPKLKAFADGTSAYYLTIQRALTNGWNKEKIGHHILRDNEISHCEQAGVVGSLGAVFSTITRNDIHDIHIRRLFNGCEQAGIKLHGAIDTVISRNHIYNCNRGLWLDWMAQGAQVTHNLFHDNATNKVEWSRNWEANVAGGEQDLFLEVNHGPILVANNLFLSPYAINLRSQGVAFVNNLITGAMRIVEEDGRRTPWHEPHSTSVRGMEPYLMGDDRYFDNIFTRYPDLRNYDKATLPMWMGGNVYLNGATPSTHETNALVLPSFDPAIQLRRESNSWFLVITVDSGWGDERGKWAPRHLLGKAKLPDQAYTNPDGTPLQLASDYFGKNRDSGRALPGPFQITTKGQMTLQVWPLPH